MGNTLPRDSRRSIEQLLSAHDLGDVLHGMANEFEHRAVRLHQRRIAENGDQITPVEIRVMRLAEILRLAARMAQI